MEIPGNKLPIQMKTDEGKYKLMPRLEGFGEKFGAKLFGTGITTASYMDKSQLWNKMKTDEGKYKLPFIELS